MQMVKKIKLGLCCGVMALASGTFAGPVAIDYAAVYGFYFNVDSNVGILGAGTGNQTFAQLVFSPDDQVDPVAYDNVLGTNGNDFAWGTTMITEGSGSTEFADFSGTTVNGTYTPGYIYARIFQDADVQVGDWYYYTTPMPLLDVSSPQGILDMNFGNVLGNAIDSGSTVAQVVVPEPTTGLLLALGGGVAWLVRLKQRLL